MSVSQISSRRTWRSINCGDGCRQVRAVPVGNNRAITLDIHDAAFHEGAAHARGRDQGFTCGQAAGAAWALLALGPRLRFGNEIVRTGALVVDRLARRVTVDGVPVVLSITEYDILEYLAANVGRACLRAEIMATVWPDGMGRRQRRNTPLQSNDPGHALDVHIVRLRRRLGVASCLLTTVPSVGYVLLSEPLEGLS